MPAGRRRAPPPCRRGPASLVAGAQVLVDDGDERVGVREVILPKKNGPDLAEMVPWLLVSLAMGGGAAVAIGMGGNFPKPRKNAR